MKKDLKKIVFNILILIALFFVFYFCITRFKYIYGSTTDWNIQHYLIPEYFRKLFYATGDLFPDFAFNLGSGQNIYNFSYYGLLSPVILFSYLLPFVGMREYIIGSTIFLLLLSAVLMYFFIKKKHNCSIAFICGFLFLMATPIFFHSHRHIMFINYLPFLIMGYFGVDRYFEKNKPILLTLSVFLMIMTSYFFSVSGIVSIILYGIYCYIKKNKNITFTRFIKDGILFLIPIIIGILMSCVLIVPTFYSLLNGRDSGSSINIFKLFLPNINIKNLLYSTYSAGLSSLALFSLIDNACFKKRENRFLSISLIVLLIIPFFMYLLNGFLYVEPKVLIAFIPAFIVLIADTLEGIKDKTINFKMVMMLTIIICCLSNFFKQFSLLFVLLIELPIMLISVFLSYRKNTFKYIYILLFPVLFITSVTFNLGDELVRRDYQDTNLDKINNILENDSSFYRIGIYDKKLATVNNIYDLEYYETTVYSSSASHHLEDFYYNRIGNEIIFRSHRQMPTTNNLFYNIYMGNKYIISNKFDSYLYEEKEEDIYVNNYVLPVGYATNKLMSLKYYESLSYPDNIYAFLDYVIVDDNEILAPFEARFEKIFLDADIIYNEVNYKREIFDLKVKGNKSSKIKLKINNDLRDKVLMIKFDMDYQENCSVGDTSITINGIKNKLTCEGWKYQNNNYTFEYILSDKNLDTLDIVFSKGEFLITNLEFYVIDYDDIYDIVEFVDPFIIDRNKTNGDFIYGDINVSNDGYFNISIPYDKGFNIYVDDEKIDYEKVNVDFIGFKIDKGHHDIRIEYQAPFKKIGLFLSVIGIILFTLEVFMVSIVRLIGNIISEIKNPQTKLGKLGMGMYKKYKELFNYLVVGVLTTVISIVSKWILLFTIFDAENAFELQVSIIISWILSVLFAYFANRIFVFCSKNKNIFKEMVSFFGARVLTLVMEMVIMWFFITLLGLDSNIWVMIWTFVTQVLIMVCNYIFSKLFVFKKK